MKFDTAKCFVLACRALSVWLICAATTKYVQAQPVEAGTGLTLQAALQRTQEANREVLSAQRAVEAAQADVQTAAVTPTSQLSLLSQGINTQNLGRGGVWSRPIDTIVRVDTPWERGGKREQRELQARSGLLAAQSDQVQTLRTQQLAVAQAYWDLKLAQVQHDIAVLEAQIAQESSHVAQVRLRQGDLSSLEATRLSLESDRALNEVEQARSQWSQAQWALAQLLAQGNAQSLRAVDPWPDARDSSMGLAAARVDGTDQAWLSARGDVQAARQRVQQAQAALALAQAQRKADVTWSVQFEHNPPSGNRLWGVGVAFPLGVDARQDGPVTRAQLAVDDAQAALEKTQVNAWAERERLRTSFDTAIARIARLDGQLVPKAKEAVKAAEFARQQGALTLQDVLDTRRLAHAAELDAAQAHADHAKALSALNLISNPSVVSP